MSRAVLFGYISPTEKDEPINELESSISRAVVMYAYILDGCMRNN